MRVTAPVSSDPHRLARAFLALGDDLAPELPQHSLGRALAAFAAVVVLAFAVPLTWMAPASRDQPAATLGSSKAVLAAADDEDDDGGE